MESNKPVLIMIAAFIIFGIWWEIGLWNECRTNNSFFYCFGTLAK